MKKSPNIRIAFALCAWAFIAVYASSSWAVTYGIKRTKHNLGTTGDNGSGSQWWSVNETEICVFCHTPHNANKSGGKKFLWNRIDPSHTFALYTASPTLNFNKSGIQISEVSKMCMSCHDGVTAINVLFNSRDIIVQNYATPEPISFSVTGIPTTQTIGADDFFTVGSGGNLTNDHPISFDYQSAKDGDNTLKAVALIDLPLWNGKVECVTCHDPHINSTINGGDVSLDPFLRKSNASSALCFTCHDK